MNIMNFGFYHQDFAFLSFFSCFNFFFKYFKFKFQLEIHQHECIFDAIMSKLTLGRVVLIFQLLIEKFRPDLANIDSEVEDWADYDLPTDDLAHDDLADYGLSDDDWVDKSGVFLEDLFGFSETWAVVDCHYGHYGHFGHHSHQENLRKSLICCNVVLKSANWASDSAFAIY